MFKDSKAFSSFSAKDIEKAKDFYSRILGLKVTEEMEGILSLHISDGNRLTVYIHLRLNENSNRTGALDSDRRRNVEYRNYFPSGIQ